MARCGGDVPAHHVFRERERAASIAAHAAGLSPELIYAEPGVMVIRHVDGTTLTEADMRASIVRIVPLLGTCHGETEVDARSDSTASESIAVYADALAARFSAELIQRFPGSPVYGCTVTSKKASSA